MKIPEEVREIFENKKPHQLATASREGIPNTSFIGATYLRDGETIVIVDNYMNKTCCNIVSNPNVAILIRNDRKAYQLKGKCRYCTEGPEYEEAKRWMNAKSEKYPAKGALIVSVEEIYYATGDERGGQKI